MEVVKIENLNKDFGNNKILKNISLSFTKGTVTTIIGPSGSGKSTLLRCINQLEFVTSGHMYFHDEDLTIQTTNVNAIRSKIGMVFQSFNLFNNLSVLENCTIGQIKVMKLSKEEATKTALIYLEKVGMTEFADRNVTTLSGGQKQRVAIARTLAMHPEVILFDEPTSSLDPEMVSGVLEVIKSIVSKEITFIVVTHEMSFAREVSDRVIFIDEGVIIEDNTSDYIFNNSPNTRLRKFLKT